ncbi:MAG: hypothetical protein JNM41_15175 [Flavipsychrobacter sp.]|nr:hypothetical protein [Flavipsychrobacter sp.]
MRNFKPVFVGSAISISILLIIYAVLVFPLPGTDSFVFMPPALSFAKNQGLTNHLYYVAEFTDPTHSNRFNYYVPFFPMALGWLSRIKPDIRTIFLICSLFSVAGITLFTATIKRHLTDKITPQIKLGLILTFTFLSIYLLPTVGRPENFSGIFIFLIFLLYRHRSQIKPALYYPVIITLFSVLFSTQVIGLFFSFLIYALFEVLNSRNVLLKCVELVAVFAAVVGGFCLILALSPHGLSETVNAIGWHIALALNRSDSTFRMLVYYWTYAPLSFGFVFIFICCLVFFLADIRSKWASAPKFTIFVSLVPLCILLIGLYKYALNAAPTVYNVTQFIFPMMTYLWLQILSPVKSRFTKLTFPVVLVTVVAGLFMFLRTFVLFADTMISGKDFATARALAESYTRNNKKVITSNGIWPIFSDIKKPYVIITDQFDKGDTIIMQEAYFSLPLQFSEKCDVIYDWRRHKPTNIFGIKLSNNPNGYGFVILKARESNK